MSRARPVCTLLTMLLCTPGKVAFANDDNEQVQHRGADKDNWWDALPREAWANYLNVAQSQDWFEVYLVGRGVFAIYEPGQFEEVISYLIVGSERALLFDTGLGIGDMHRLVSELTDQPVVVLNSHSHYDHVGGNHQFETIYGSDTEFARRHAAGRGPEELAEYVGPGWVWKELPEGFDRETYAGRPYSLDRVVVDGETIDLGNRSLEVLLTPGHAPDALCLLDRDSRLLFSGDTLYPAPLYAHLEGSEFSKYEATAMRLAKLADQVEHVLPGHNEPRMESSQLLRMRDAFADVQQDDRSYRLTDGNREYDFGAFSIIVADPPPWESSEADKDQATTE